MSEYFVGSVRKDSLNYETIVACEEPKVSVKSLLESNVA